MYALVFFALELWQGSWVHYSLYIKQGLQLSLEFQNTKSNPPFPPLCSFFSDALHTRVLHMCVEVFAACAYICAFHWNYYFFDKHVFAAVPQISVFHSPNFRSAFFMQPIPPSSKIHQCFVLFVFFASNFLLIRPLHGSLLQFVLSRDCKEIIMWKTKLDKDHHIIMSSNCSHFDAYASQFLCRLSSLYSS